MTVQEKSRVPSIIADISRRSVGHSFWEIIYKYIIRSPECMCILAKNEDNRIIGCIFGTLVTIQKINEASLRIFHIWFAGKDERYPALGFLTKILDHEKCLLATFKPDFLSLSVAFDNKISQQIYANSKFETSEFIENAFQGRPAQFMLKRINLEAAAPSYSEVTDAVISHAVAAPGPYLGKAIFLSWKIKEFIRKL